MKIGFDVSQTSRLKAGCGYFAYSLIGALAEMDSENEYLLYPTFGDAYLDADWPSATVQVSKPNFRRGLGHACLDDAQLFWRSPPADFESQLGQPDIVHANNFFCPVGLKKARLVYTLYDLGFIEHPEFTTEENRLICFSGVFNASLYADTIVAISEYSRRHFLETFPHYPSERVVVVYPASRFVGRPAIPRPQSLSRLDPGHFWLNVGTLEPRKNHRRLLLAYAQLKAQAGETWPLALAGGQGWLMGDFVRFIDELGLRQDVVLLGYVDERELQWLYQNCFAFVYPSLFEGFGMPVLEAMSLGAAVITSNVTSIPEIVGQAGILIDPTSATSIGQAMMRLAMDQQEKVNLQQLAVQQARNFSWTATAQAILACYRHIGSRPKTRE